MNKISNKLDLNNYTQWLEERNKAKTTINNYLNVLKQFWQYKNISTQAIKEFLKENITKYQPGSLKLFRYALSSYTKFAKFSVDWEWIKGIIPKTQRKCFATLSLEELEQLKSFKSEKSKITHQRNNLIFDLLFYSGLRVNELVNIKHSDWKRRILKNTRQRQ